MLPLPYGASLRRPGADGLFELTVPPVTFLWLEVAPLGAQTPSMFAWRVTAGDGPARAAEGHALA